MKNLNFAKLQCTIPDALLNFVPHQIKLFVGHVIYFIAWQNKNAVLYKFVSRTKTNVDEWIKEDPCHIQVITCENNILDVVELGTVIAFIDVEGCIFSLCDTESSTSQLELVLAYKLSPLKAVKAVVVLSEREDSFVHFVAFSSVRGTSSVDAELYSVEWKDPSHGKFVLESVNNVPLSKSTRNKEVISCSTILCSAQLASNIFTVKSDLTTILLGLSSGQFLGVFINLGSNKLERKIISFKLLYVTPWPIQTIMCSPDDERIFLLLEDGVMIVVTANLIPSASVFDEEEQKQLSFNGFSLPEPIRTCHVQSSGELFCSNFAHFWRINKLSSNTPDVEKQRLKGVTAFCGWKDISLAATHHRSFYLLENNVLDQSSNSKSENEKKQCSSDSLNTSMQYVLKMKEEIDLLTDLQNQLNKEDMMISGVSSAIRAYLLNDKFEINVKVYNTAESELFETETKLSCYNFSNHEHNSRFWIEIVNNSDEDFCSSLWDLFISVRNTKGVIVCKTLPLNQTLKSKSVFATWISIPVSCEHLSLPVTLKAHLVAEMMGDTNRTNVQWLSIPLGKKELDISYFIDISLEQPTISNKCTIVEYVVENICNCYSMKTAKSPHAEDRSLDNDVSYTIHIPQEYRHINIILEKILINCRHRLSKRNIQDLLGLREEQAFYINAGTCTAKLVLKKSCAYFLISSNNLSALHLIKSWINNLLHPAEETVQIPQNVQIKSKNLMACLEVKQFQKKLDPKEVISLYKEVRTLVSSYTPV